ncbi:hypothetical protein CICLE_v10030199mg [Citrus x clementina]|uniref:Uncharacterized protein n=1 Tax=Citrus clementina TaxID=85681 RepID=V4UGA4_CITCL|nr:hypothetical protein CICLE_v10030199mg [Citrus x clementina]GAY37797.1 hypothetical protein CUMW_031770 [Citrus unshiu]
MTKSTKPIKKRSADNAKPLIILQVSEEFNKLLVRFVKSSLISCLTKPITELQNHLVSPLTRNQGHCNLICNWIQAKTLKSFGVTINTNGLSACNFYKKS